MTLPALLIVPTNVCAIVCCGQPTVIIPSICQVVDIWIFFGPLRNVRKNWTMQPPFAPFFKQILRKTCRWSTDIAYNASEVQSIMKANIDKVLVRGATLCALDEKAEVMHAHASSFKSLAQPRRSWIPSFGAKLSEAANWVSSIFKCKKTWEWNVYFSNTNTLFWIFFLHKYQTEMLFNFSCCFSRFLLCYYAIDLSAFPFTHFVLDHLGQKLFGFSCNFICLRKVRNTKRSKICLWQYFLDTYTKKDHTLPFKLQSSIFQRSCSESCAVDKMMLAFHSFGQWSSLPCHVVAVTWERGQIDTLNSCWKFQPNMVSIKSFERVAIYLVNDQPMGRVEDHSPETSINKRINWPWHRVNVVRMEYNK